jgi:hypothetical protein
MYQSVSEIEIRICQPYLNPLHLHLHIFLLLLLLLGLLGSYKFEPLAPFCQCSRCQKQQMGKEKLDINWNNASFAASSLRAQSLAIMFEIRERRQMLN